MVEWIKYFIKCWREYLDLDKKLCAEVRPTCTRTSHRYCTQLCGFIITIVAIIIAFYFIQSSLPKYTFHLRQVCQINHEISLSRHVCYCWLNIIFYTYRVCMIGRSQCRWCLRHELSSTLKHWDCGFESDSKHGFMFAFIIFVLFCEQVAALRRGDLPSKESYLLCIG
jgi:hypothetical protein